METGLVIADLVVSASESEGTQFREVTVLGVSGGTHQSRRGGVGGRVGDTNTGS